jgi:hypothetical protein
MSIATTLSIRSTRRLSLAASAAATTALLLLASACGTENAVGQAPRSISVPTAASTERQSPADREECLVNQAKNRDNGTTSCLDLSDQASGDGQPQYLAPSGRPVPLPGQGG